MPALTAVVTTARWRLFLMLTIMILVVFGLVYRAYVLQLVNEGFLKGEGQARHLRVVKVSAHRGSIFDRNGDVMAMSTPVDSVWADPQQLIKHPDQWQVLSQALDINLDRLGQRLHKNRDREFVYLSRHLTPKHAEQISDLNIPGVFLQREYKRYYSLGAVASHIVGFTNIDDQGQEGLELAFEDWLQGSVGSKRVIKDRLGRTIADVEQIKPAIAGKDIELTIDRHIQFFAYSELAAAINKHQARSGSAIVIDSVNGEVLALANYPSYNPNKRSTINVNRIRNRAVLDLFEPGSTLKPFIVAAALDLGLYQPDTIIDTRPGRLNIDGHMIRDIRNYGLIDVATVIKKSSNVGISKIALSIPADALWAVLSGIGFGSVSESGFPGEPQGMLRGADRWSQIDHATLGFGYGLSVTSLQLARAYLVLANDGRRVPVKFIMDQGDDQSQQLISKYAAVNVRTMMRAVVQQGGTGTAAAISGYSVAGKTGTIKKSSRDGYSKDRYIALFAGIVPASKPRFVMVVMIDEPSNGDYYGGLVSAPVFSRVMAEVLRLRNISPDRPDELLKVAAMMKKGGDFAPVQNVDAENAHVTTAMMGRML